MKGVIPCLLEKYTCKDIVSIIEDYYYDTEEYKKKMTFAVYNMQVLLLSDLDYGYNTIHNTCEIYDIKLMRWLTDAFLKIKSVGFIKNITDARGYMRDYNIREDDIRKPTVFNLLDPSLNYKYPKFKKNKKINKLVHKGEDSQVYTNSELKRFYLFYLHRLNPNINID